MHKTKTPGMNKHQKAAHRPGEPRVSREDIAVLLELSRSEDPEERLVAATYLCPCHVRHRDEEVWEALYRMMEDPDVRVRRRAWHTLEDGGCPSDPAFEPILKRTLAQEQDRTVLGFARMFARPYEEKERIALRTAARPERKQRGKCDFCGETDVFVRRDLDTMIPTDGMPRAAWICDACAK
jgi:hypothetical protein